jgi:hypothetical protein
MEFVVICLPKAIGEAATRLEWRGNACGPTMLLSEARIRAPNLSTGDVVAEGEAWFIISQSGDLRAVSETTVKSWQHKTPVERAIGSGELARVQSGRLKPHVAIMENR